MSMKYRIVLAALVIVSFTPRPSPAQTDATASLSPKEREELQARIYMARKDYLQAEKVYAQLASEYPRDPTYPNAIGIAKQQQDDLRGAALYYQRAAKVDKKFATAYSNLGTIFYAQKQYAKAIAQYRKAISVEPEVAGYYTNLGYAYFAQKKFPQAYANFQKAMAINPNIFQENDRNGSVMTYQTVTDRGLFDFMLAKSYAQKADAMNCAVYLRKAHDEGYKPSEKDLNDKSFDAVRMDPNVKTLLDLMEPPQKTASSASSGS
jgi:tetratricopeptide (TPR) repeat protein